MSHYRPYPAYRPSGIPWLGDIPKGWDVRPLKRLAKAELSNVDKLTVEGQTSVRLCNYVDVYKNERIIPTLPFMEASASKDQIRRLTLKQGDVLITKDSETPDDIGIPALVDEDMDGVVCGYHLALLRPERGHTVGGYLQRIIQSDYVKAEFFCSALGLTRYGLSKYDIESLKLPVPPVADQLQIAVALDRETARIDALIAKKTEFIDLLNKKRQALITHAVTKGLDPKVKLLYSEVEWMGDVPKHWVVQPMKYVVQVGNGSTPARDNADYWDGGTFPWLTSGCVNLEDVDRAEECVTEKALAECHLPVISPPAVLIGITGQGKTRGMASTLLIEATINQHIAFLKPRSDAVNIAFLRRFVDAAYEWLRFDSEGVGSTKGAITCEQLANLKIALPPRLEQDSIVEKMRRQCSRLDALKSRTQHSIDLLKQRRSALITAAVTGQIDLRESA